MDIAEALGELRDYAVDGKKYCYGSSPVAFAAYMELLVFKNSDHAYWRGVKENAEFQYEAEIADIMLLVTDILPTE